MELYSISGSVNLARMRRETAARFKRFGFSFRRREHAARNLDIGKSLRSLRLQPVASSGMHLDLRELQKRRDEEMVLLRMLDQREGTWEGRKICGAAP